MFSFFTLFCNLLPCPQLSYLLDSLRLLLCTEKDCIYYYLARDTDIINQENNYGSRKLAI